MFTQSHARLFAAATPVAPAPRLRHGIVAGTMVEGEHGWLRAETLAIGTRLQTHDGGLRPVRAIDRFWLDAEAAGDLVMLPGGTFDNCADLVLLPDQALLVDGDCDATPLALVPAAALLAIGARPWRAAGPVEVVAPVFAEEEAVWACSGVRLHCPGVAGADDFYPRLALARARRLVAGQAA